MSATSMEVGLVLGILAVAVYLFVTEKLPPALVALLVLALTLVTGLLPVEAALSGFSSPALFTVALIYVLSGALERTGVVRALVRPLDRMAVLGDIPLLVALIVLGGATSAFLNNTAVVAVLLPAMIVLCRKHKRFPSRFLMPLSFASQFGGVCTLIGTSTNLLVNGIVEKNGLPSIGFFELAPLGVVLSLVGGIYMVVVGKWLLPRRGDASDLADAYRTNEFIAELWIPEESPWVGKSAADLDLSRRLDVEVLEVIRNDQPLLPYEEGQLRPGDRLMVAGSREALMNLRQEEGGQLRGERHCQETDFEEGDVVMTEVLVGAGSGLLGSTARELEFGQRFGVGLLAIQRRNQFLRKKLSNIAFHIGDQLLLLGRKKDIRRAERTAHWIVLEEMDPRPFRPGKAWVALAVFAAAILLAATGTVPIVIGALVAAIVCVSAGCLRIEEAIDSVDWNIILLIGGLLPIGIAMERAGVADAVAGITGRAAEHFGPYGVLALVFVATALLTELMSNNAAAAVMAPLAIASAGSVGIDPRPLIVAVMVAASTSFATPVGYQTNMMIYGPGGYRFSDFLKFGGFLNALFAAVSIWLIPRIWPF